jgi:hypothetical protein
MHSWISSGAWRSRISTARGNICLLWSSRALVVLAFSLVFGLSSAASASEYSLNNFSELSGGWTPDRYPRVLADVDGDGDDDIVGFGHYGVYVSRSFGDSFEKPYLWNGSFGYASVAGGWRVEMHPRMLGDVTGDGMADIVGFGGNYVYVSRSTGTGFLPAERWVASYGYKNGWRVDQHPRFVEDMNGDGLADVVGFGGAGVFVSLSTGAGFQSPQRWVDSFGYVAGGWNSPEFPRHLADVNGDGLPDVVGFGNAGVFVSLSNGSSFGSPALWIASFGYSAGTWRASMHPRTVADVNGDGMADVVGFGNRGAYVALSNGDAFEPARIWIPDFGHWAGWRVDKHVRIVQDVNGDGRADVVGFGDDDGVVALSDGQWFGPKQRWTSRYGYNDGWRTTPHIRTLGQMDGDARPEIVAFGFEGVAVFDDFSWTLMKAILSLPRQDLQADGYKYGVTEQPPIEPPSGFGYMTPDTWEFFIRDRNPELVTFAIHWKSDKCHEVTCVHRYFVKESDGALVSDVLAAGGSFERDWISGDYRYYSIPDEVPYGEPGEYDVWVAAIAGPTYLGYEWAVHNGNTVVQVCNADPGGVDYRNCDDAPDSGTGDSDSTDSGDTPSVTFRCGTGSCASGEYAAAFLHSDSCLGTGRNQTKCIELGATSIYPCGIGCPTGYSVDEYQYSTACDLSTSTTGSDNQTLCLKP